MDMLNPRYGASWSPATPPATVERAVSLTQPWATLWAHGLKRHETRSWATHFRGWLAIHAAATFPKHCRLMCLRQPFAGALASLGFNRAEDLPLGRLLAVAWLGDCISTDAWTPERDSAEYAFGNYAPGRYAWRSYGSILLREPMPAKGHLSIWKLATSGLAIAEADLGATAWGLT